MLHFVQLDSEGSLIISVMLSATKHLTVATALFDAMLHCVQHDTVINIQNRVEGQSPPTPLGLTYRILRALTVDQAGHRPHPRTMVLSMMSIGLAQGLIAPHPSNTVFH